MTTKGLTCGIALVVLGQTAVAQQAVIDRCRQTSSDADRIACLEAALLGREQAPAAEPQARVESTPEPAATQTPTPAGIGAEQVVARSQSKEERRDSLEELRGQQVASYSYVPYERLVVRLENGQVWRQIKGDTKRIRVDLKRNQTADITESNLGGYKLRLNEMRRTIRVERIK